MLRMAKGMQRSNKCELATQAARSSHSNIRPATPHRRRDCLQLRKLLRMRPRQPLDLLHARQRRALVSHPGAKPYPPTRPPRRWGWAAGGAAEGARARQRWITVAIYAARTKTRKG
jgi:hypothetical protein